MTKLSRIAAVALSCVGFSGLALYSKPASAGNAYSVTIIRVSTNVNATGAVVYTIFFNGNEANIGCNSPNLNGFSFDASTAAGKTAVAISLVAQATGQTVTIFGAGNCSVAGNIETASLVSIP